MYNQETIPLTCPKCRHVTTRELRWVQENVFYTCAGCHGTLLIDKDQAMRLLATLAREPR